MNYINNMQWQIQNSDDALAFNLDYENTSVWKVPILGKSAANLPFYVQEVGYTVAHEHYFVRRNSLDSFFIGIAETGEMALKYNGKETIVKANDCMWLDCRKPHFYGTAPGTRLLQAYFVHFYGPGAIHYFEYFSEFNNAGFISGDCRQAALMYLKKLLDLYRYDNRALYTDLSANSLLTALCQTLLEAAYVPQQKCIPEYIIDIRKHIEENYMKRITLHDLSNLFFLSPSYIQKQFKRFLDVSPAEYLVAARIKHAKRLLRSTNDSILNISESVGFTDESYFVKVFGKAEGISPLQYRRLWMNI